MRLKSTCSKDVHVEIPLDTQVLHACRFFAFYCFFSWMVVLLPFVNPQEEERGHPPAPHCVDMNQTAAARWRTIIAAVGRTSPTLEIDAAANMLRDVESQDGGWARHRPRLCSHRSADWRTELATSSGCPSLIDWLKKHRDGTLNGYFFFQYFLMWLNWGWNVRQVDWQSRLKMIHSIIKSRILNSALKWDDVLPSYLSRNEKYSFTYLNKYSPPPHYSTILCTSLKYVL